MVGLVGGFAFAVVLVAVDDFIYYHASEIFGFQSVGAVVGGLQVFSLQVVAVADVGGGFGNAVDSVFLKYRPSLIAASVCCTQSLASVRLAKDAD